MNFAESQERLLLLRSKTTKEKLHFVRNYSIHLLWQKSKKGEVAVAVAVAGGCRTELYLARERPKKELKNNIKKYQDGKSSDR